LHRCLRRNIVVLDVEAYPGHIARDEQMKSEIVCPLILRSSGKEVGLGVLIWTAWRKPVSIKTIGPAWRRQLSSSTTPVIGKVVM
jgi:hypothetical protein